MIYDIVSFDLDGTLVDTASEIAEAANRALAAHGIERRPVPEITQFIGHGTRELIIRLVERVVTERPALADRLPLSSVLAGMDQHYAQTTGTTATPYEGTVEALQMLSAAGVKLACVTNKEFRHACRVLTVTGLAPYFELTIGGGEPLRPQEAGKGARTRGELGPRPRFHQPATFEHVDHIGVLDRRQPVGDDHRGDPAGRLPHGAEDLRFAR